MVTSSNRWVLGALTVLSVMPIHGDVRAAEAERTNGNEPGKDWVARFAFQSPKASTEGVCALQGGPLPSFVVTPGEAGRQLVRISLPFAQGLFSAELGLAVQAGGREIVPDVQVLTYHAGRPACVRRAILSFIYDFANVTSVRFTPVLRAGGVHRARPRSGPGVFEAKIGELYVKVDAAAIEVGENGKRVWRAELRAPPLVGAVEPTSEVIASGETYLWARLLVPDERWPRILEVRADALGTVAIRVHVQRLEPTPDPVARAPDIGWRIVGLASEKQVEHSFAGGETAHVIAGRHRVDFPGAHLLRRGALTVRNSGAGSEITYLRCRKSEQVPMQYASWRTATAVVGPKACAAWTPLLEPAHAVRIGPEAFDALYRSGSCMDLSVWGLLSGARQYHVEAIASSTLHGDDFGNVTAMPTSGVAGMNRLNHCPPIFEEYYRRGDSRLRDVAMYWCENFHDLTIWWGTDAKTRFGGTRYPDIARHGERPADPGYMWRSNSSVSFCTKGCSSFFYAYEETGDPRMAAALRWQVDYASHEIHANTGECRNIGAVEDFVRLYEFTGKREHLEQGLRLFRELRTKLSTGDLFDQGGKPIAATLPFMDNDRDGLEIGYAKPYIIGYALLGLPKLAGYCPDEPKLREVVRAAADFQAGAQNPSGGWSYPHPRSSGASLALAMEWAAQLARAADCLERGGEEVGPLLDAIERALQQRILAWGRSGRLLLRIGGWEEAAGLLNDGKRLTDMYKSPEERDRSRDFTEGALSFGDAPPEGVVYFFEALAFYLAHRPAERLYHAGEALEKVLARIPVSAPASQF